MISIEKINDIKYPYELFDDDIEEIKKTYVDLMKVYNPNLNGQKKEYIEITKKIDELYKKAEENEIKGIWNKPGFIKLKCIDEKYYSMKFRISHSFELGDMYIGNDSILYLMNEKYERLVLNAINKLKSIKYSNDDMKKEFNRYLPQVKTIFRTIEGKIGVVIEKDEDLVLLRDLLTYCNGKISINTVSWILNSLYNLICFINFNGLTHNGITIDSYFVSLKGHYGALLGGWWYSTKDEKTILEVTKKIKSDEMNQSKKSNSKEDLKAIKILGRILFGDKSEIVALRNSSIQRELIIWLDDNNGNNPFEEYSTWRNITRKITNEKGIKVNIDKDDLYKKLGGN